MTHPTRQALIQALLNAGLFYVRDLPSHKRIVRKAEVVEMRRKG